MESNMRHFKRSVRKTAKKKIPLNGTSAVLIKSCGGEEGGWVGERPHGSKGQTGVLVEKKLTEKKNKGKVWKVWRIRGGGRGGFPEGTLQGEERLLLKVKTGVGRENGAFCFVKKNLGKGSAGNLEERLCGGKTRRKNGSPIFQNRKIAKKLPRRN